jgi:hypothetical protein
VNKKVNGISFQRVLFIIIVLFSSFDTSLRDSNSN